MELPARYSYSLRASKSVPSGTWLVAVGVLAVESEDAIQAPGAVISGLVRPSRVGPRPLKSATFPIRVKVTPDGAKVLVSNAESGDLAVFDRPTRKELGRIPMAEEQTDDEGRMFSDFEGAVPIGILLHPRSEVAWVANTNADIVSVIDLKTMKVTARIPTGKQPDGLGWSAVTGTAP